MAASDPVHFLVLLKFLSKCLCIALNFGESTPWNLAH